MWSRISGYTENRIGTRTDPWVIPQIKPCLSLSAEQLENVQTVRMDRMMLLSSELN